jgi:hypothetical protein
MKIGYARVSIDDQNPDLQLAALMAAGCDKIVADKGHVRGLKARGVAFTVAAAAINTMTSTDSAPCGKWPGYTSGTRIDNRHLS